MTATGDSDSTPRPRQARAEATRTALLDAALQEFAAYGFEGASTRAIATRAGTHQPQINYHFETKDALWRAAVDYLFRQLDDASTRHLPPSADRVSARDDFAAGVRAFVKAVASLPELNRIMVQEAMVGSDRLEWIVEQHTRPRFDAMTKTWRHLRDSGQANNIDETVMYYSLIGAASLAYVNAPEARLLGRDTLAEAFVDAHADALVLMFLGSETAALLASLNAQRRHILGILEGLSDEALRRPVLPSGWTCLGLVRHLTLDVERFWFEHVVAGEATITDDAADAAWHVEPDEPAQEVLDAYRNEIERANAIITATPPDAAPRWWPTDLFGSFRLKDLREVVLHVIAETACHAGHLDAARELIDGHTWLILTD